MSSWHKEGLLSVSRRHFDFGNHFLSARHLVPAGWDTIDSPVLQQGQGSAKLDSPCAEILTREGTLTSPSQLLCTFPCFLTEQPCSSHLCKEPGVDAQVGSGLQGSCMCSVTHGYNSTHPSLHPCQGTLQTPSASASRCPSLENQGVGWKELVHCRVSPTWATAQLEHTPRPEQCCWVLQFRHKKGNPIPSSALCIYLPVSP